MSSAVVDASEAREVNASAVDKMTSASHQLVAEGVPGPLARVPIIQQPHTSSYAIVWLVRKVCE